MPHRVETIDVTANKKRLFIRDRKSGIKFLIDTGSDISLLPADGNSKRSRADYVLYAANNSPINTYGERRLSLNFGFKRSLIWNFCVASVPYAIIGADLLSHFGLNVDLRNHRLIDTHSGIGSVCVIGIDFFNGVSTVNKSMSFTDILADFPRITGLEQSSEIAARGIYHQIETTGFPVSERPRRLTSDKLEIAKKQFKSWVDEKKCRPAQTTWASPLHMAAKKGGGYRPCGDYRRVNAQTIPDSYPVPYLQDFTSNLFGKTIFTKLDLHAAYNQIPVAPEDIPKTTITTPFGSFEFLVMTFGLRNASSTFQRYIDLAMRDFNFVFAYVDDILIASSNLEEHKCHLRQVFQRLDKFGLRLNLEKCSFGVTELEFLGHTVNAKGIGPTEDRVKAIVNYEKPKTVVELRRFLGLVNFYRRCLPSAAEAQRPLNAYLHNSKKNDRTKIDWSPEADKAFAKICHDITQIALLAHPDSNSQTRLVTDASDTGIGASVEQFQDGSWKPLAFFSRSLTSTQRKYSTYDRELTAVYQSIKYFDYLLQGREFKVVTDHKPLIYAFQQKSDKASPRQLNQLSFISQYTTNFEYLPGKENVVADSLSRINAVIFASEISLAEMTAAQKDDPELKSLLESGSSSLNLKSIRWGPDHTSIVCDLSGEVLRPFIPVSLRKRIFHLLHDPAHPGAKVSCRVITKSYVWPGINKDIKDWCKECLSCQKAKVTRHTILQPSHFVAPEDRFRHIHMDIIGPLPACDGYRYCLTLIDRFSRWPEAFPLKNVDANSVCRAFFSGWISRFGSPETLTTDRGSQFESQLFPLFSNCLDVKESIPQLTILPLMVWWNAGIAF